MNWQCPTCRSYRAVIDFFEDEPKVVGCLECDWVDVAEHPEDRDAWRCFAPIGRSSYMHRRGRCSRRADINGMCRQHADKSHLWDAMFHRLLYRDGEEIPDIYREMFVRACQDVHLLDRHQRDERRENELMGAAAGLRRAKRDQEKSSVVYFMRREGLIKIGVTTDIAKRAKAVSKGSSMADGMTIGPVEVLATTPGDAEFESRLHRQFGASRVQGEWFRPTPKLLSLIARYQRRTAEHAAA